MKLWCKQHMMLLWEGSTTVIYTVGTFSDHLLRYCTLAAVATDRWSEEGTDSGI